MYPYIEFFVLQYPQKFHFLPNYDPQLDEAIQEIIKDYPELNYVDLSTCYENEMQVDGLTFESYYWEIDGHHNAKGYLLKAQCVYETLIPYLKGQNLQSVHSPN